MLFLVPGIKRLLKGKTPQSLHKLTIKSISGSLVPLAQFKGKKLLIINTASQCGFTPQYKALQMLHEKYSSKNLVILAFPCNDFGRQEPEKEQVIAQFCKLNFSLSFVLMEKLHVKGSEQHPLYAWLCSKEKNGIQNSFVLWNFQKYLVDENGYLINVVAPWISPLNAKILKWLKEDKPLAQASK